jgi:hypothetical protein
VEEMKDPDLFEDEFLDHNPLPGLVMVLGITLSLLAFGAFLGFALAGGFR